MSTAAQVFTKAWANTVFPPERADAFFDALYGGAEEGAFDIALRFVKQEGAQYEFSFDLQARPQKCLVCSLTYGLPHVFSRHPIINIKDVVASIAAALGKTQADVTWELRPTVDTSPNLFQIPLIVTAA